MAGSPSWDGEPDGSSTAWAALGLVAADAAPVARALVRLDWLRRHKGVESPTKTDLALYVVALAALGDTADDLVARLRQPPAPGTLVNATIWTVLALRLPRRSAAAGSVR